MEVVVNECSEFECRLTALRFVARRMPARGSIPKFAALRSGRRRHSNFRSSTGAETVQLQAFVAAFDAQFAHQEEQEFCGLGLFQISMLTICAGGSRLILREVRIVETGQHIEHGRNELGGFGPPAPMES